MPRFFLILIAFIIAGSALLVGIFMNTGPTKNQDRAPHEQSRDQIQLPK